MKPAVLRRPPRPIRPAARRRLLRPSRQRRRRAWWWVPLALGLGVWIGRWTAPPAVGPEEPPAEPEPERVATASTSSAACCPCPAPRRPAKLPRRPVAAVTTPPAPPRDPTAETGRYLRGSAERFAPCAPPGAAPLRVHVEIAVAPSGAVEGARITNLDPVPSEVSACVERTARALTPPGFDGSRSELFSLTLRL